MKRGSFVLFVCLELLFASPRVGWAAEPAAGSPEAVVAKAMDAMNHGRIGEFVKSIHPDALKELRTLFVEILDLSAKNGKEDQIQQAFPGIKSAKEVKSLNATQLASAFFRGMLNKPEMKQALANTRIDILGRIDKGTDTAFVVYRTRMKLGEVPFVREYVAYLRKSGPDWKLELPDDLAGQLPAIKRSLAGDLTLPDINNTRIEVIGHVLDGNETALIVYRAIMPLGDSSMSKLTVLNVKKDAPGWAAARADKTAEIEALIKSRLGISKPRATTTRTSSRATATATASVSTKSGSTTSTATATASAASSTIITTTRGTGPGMSARPRGSAKFPPRIATRTPSRTRPRTARPSASEESELPDGLTALPAKFFGNNRDRFHDLAPADGVLVGARVSYIMRFGGPKISSVQPVYRVGEKLVDGERHGGLLGEETSAVAKPGYAVGAVNTHTGLTVDGFEMVFMRIDGDHLDTADSYSSPWLGDEKGGSPRDVSSDGKIPVGLQGRAGKEVNALGLIVGK